MKGKKEIIYYGQNLKLTSSSHLLIHDYIKNIYYIIGRFPTVTKVCEPAVWAFPIYIILKERYHFLLSCHIISIKMQVVNQHMEFIIDNLEACEW